MKRAKSLLETKRKSALNDPEIKKEVRRLARLEKSVTKQKQVFTRTLGLANAQAALGREGAYKKMKDKAYKELDKLTELRSKFEADSTSVKMKFAAKFQIEASQRKSVVYESSGNTQVDTTLKTAFKNLERFISPNVHSIAFDTAELNAYVEKNPKQGLENFSASGRSFARNNSIVIAKNAPAVTVIHEFGHLIEDNLPNGRKLAQGFLHSRVGEEPLTNLRQRYGEFFGSEEHGRKDNFDKVFGEKSAHYVGKHYPGGSTEIIAMGVEQFFRDPIKFAKADPEYFNFVIGIMHGDLK